MTVHESEYAILKMRLEVAMAEKAAAEAQANVIRLGRETPVTPVETPIAKKPRAKKEPKPKKEKPLRGLDPATVTIVALPDCKNVTVPLSKVDRRLAGDTPLLFKVVYRTGKNYVDIYGVAGDEIHAGSRKLWLRPLLRDGSRMVINSEDVPYSEGFPVVAHGKAFSGGEVLGMVVEPPAETKAA